MLKKSLSHPPTLARQDAPLPKLRSRLASILNVPPREGARLGVLGVGGCNKVRLRLIPACRLAREGTRLGVLGVGGCNSRPF
jgi:hypothetical protein